jgi:hypothetical protein
MTLPYGIPKFHNIYGRSAVDLHQKQLENCPANFHEICYRGVLLDFVNTLLLVKIEHL